MPEQPDITGLSPEAQKLYAALAAQLAQHRAPTGGTEISGKPYAGGEFIPKEAWAEATPEERRAVENPAAAKANKEPTAKVNELGDSVVPGGIAPTISHDMLHSSVVVAIDLDGPICEKSDAGNHYFGAIKPGAREALVAMRHKGWRVVIWTSRPLPLAEKWLRSNGVPHDDLATAPTAYVTGSL